jgi:hypothetical protein
MSTAIIAHSNEKVNTVNSWLYGIKASGILIQPEKYFHRNFTIFVKLLRNAFVMHILNHHVVVIPATTIRATSHPSLHSCH